jgi:hypothetical protein
MLFHCLRVPGRAHAGLGMHNVVTHSVLWDFQRYNSCCGGHCVVLECVPLTASLPWSTQQGVAAATVSLNYTPQILGMQLN